MSGEGCLDDGRQNLPDGGRAFKNYQIKTALCFDFCHMFGPVSRGMRLSPWSGIVALVFGLESMTPPPPSLPPCVYF